MSKTRMRRESSGWQIFLKSVGFTVAAIILIALGFFAAMAITGVFMK